METSLVDRGVERDIANIIVSMWNVEGELGRARQKGTGRGGP